MKPRFSLAGRLTLLTAALLLISTGFGGWLSTVITPWWSAWFIALAITVPVLVLSVQRILRPTVQLIQAVKDGAESLKDNDFSVSIAQPRDAEMASLVEAYNGLGSVLREERQTLFQRELLLDTVIQTTDSALILANRDGRVVYSNTAARGLFLEGRPVNGHRFVDLLENVPDAFSEAVSQHRDGLFTIEGDEPRVYHLAQNTFTLNTQPHKLYLFRHMTKELGRQEVAIWKKLIRVISHELNNSLAPISSLAHSGLRMLDKPAVSGQLPTVFKTIEERAEHLNQFIENYSRFARLPAPRLEPVYLPEFVRRLRYLADFQMHHPCPDAVCSMDPSQIEQVMINLLKNAKESGSPADAITIAVDVLPARTCFTIADKGGGISEAVMRNALLPFYSTKASGTGLGLPLCREIVEAHGGSLSLSNIAQEGLEVRVALPNTPVAASS